MPPVVLCVPADEIVTELYPSVLRRPSVPVRVCEYRGCAWGWQGSRKGSLFDVELVAAYPVTSWEHGLE